MGGIVGALTGWLLFGGVTLATGAVVARWTILPRLNAETPAESAWLAARTAAIGFAGTLALLPAVGLFFYRQLEEFRDPFAPWAEDASLLLSTDWGTSWKWAVAASVVLPILFWVARGGGRIAWLIATVVLLALCSFPAFTGHAAAAETGRVLAITLDTVHVWAAGGWVGALAVILYLEWAWLRAQGASSLLPSLVPAFSTVAMVSVGLLVVTGVAGAWRILPSFGALFQTSYGRVLLIKLGLVGLVLGMGALNFRVLTPRLGAVEGNAAMRRSATIELVVGQIVLVVTAILVRMSPTGH